MKPFWYVDALVASAKWVASHIRLPAFARVAAALRAPDNAHAHHARIRTGAVRMKTSAIVCAVLAGTLGFSGLASAREWSGEPDHDRGHRGNRFEQRQDRHDRQEQRAERRQDRSFHEGYRAGMQQPRYSVEQPRYTAPAYPRYAQPVYGAHAPRFHRGGYLPNPYRGHAYHVNDWRAYNGLYAPPYGHQWVNVYGEFLLVALATGLIANAILSSY
jgi:Ni/Co efflux regulator RcnB